MDERTPVVRVVDLGTARLLPDVDRPAAWLLTVDDAPQSYLDLDDPTHLEFEYVRRLGHAVDTAGPPGAPLRVLHLGGGALTLPRYVAATRPGSRQRVVEGDGRLAALVAETLPSPGAGIEVTVADARAAVEAAPPGAADLLVADVFGGSRVPAQVTTLGYARAAARALRPGGTYAANLADAAPFAFLRSQLATLAACFAELCLLAEPAVLRGRRFGNVVVLAGDAEPPVAALARRAAADPFPARVVTGRELARLIGGARPVTEESAVSSPRPPADAFRVG
ncbi:spermidine synthase-like protein [Streptomyces sp. 3MP-14]|uniref:Spermidine synthase-like protein n=1 Tax=Streptomyces mimosae TaxID=2586635 RepID=A0A5N6A0F0_9ACTN|nr:MULTISPECIES: fused MFS/spermidine synthase [Streptomyces]KAB8162005.1 spermidine synthase-like protein [Streptomyces mimosae]KAB8173703.1 spermidine synthase-like protein [Streptomyces sp. 3MP-14]